jgi:hypothetical protein
MRGNTEMTNELGSVYLMTLVGAVVSFILGGLGATIYCAINCAFGW